MAKKQRKSKKKKIVSKRSRKPIVSKSVDKADKVNVDRELNAAIESGMVGKDLEIYAAILKSHNAGRQPTCYTIGYDAQGREIVAYSL